MKWIPKEGIDNFPLWNVYDENGWFIAECKKEYALIIAAAPELFESLEMAEQTLRNLGNGELIGEASEIALNASANCADAIRKAKGE